MDAKENALRIIHFDHPDRIVGSPPCHTIRYQGCNHEGFEGDLGDDHPVGSRWIDIWGTGWHKIQESVMGLPEVNPLAKLEKLQGYRWPDPNDARICAKIYRLADEFAGGDAFLAGSHRDTLWEKAYMLVGMENIMVAFFVEPDLAHEVLHRIMDFQLGIAQHYAAVGVEFVSLGDDLGTQLGSFLGPSIVDTFLVPEYERLFRFYKERNVLIGFHSCGNVEPMLETFIQLGVDVLNPIQATANNLGRVRTITQGRMALQGGISSATIMDGPVERIRAQVRERIWQLGRQGGYFCAPDQGMPYPQAHVDALNEAILTYGQYPLAENAKADATP